MGPRRAVLRVAGARVAAAAGIVAAGTTTFLPLDPGWRITYTPVGAGPFPAGEEPTAQFHSADAGYFAAIRAPVLRGRTFDAHDDAAATPVVIVNETLAKRLWPNEDPIGKRITTTLRQIGPLARRIVPGDEHQVV